MDIVKQFNRKLYDELIAISKKINEGKAPGVSICNGKNIIPKNYLAYYGDSSYITKEFITLKTPTIILNPETFNFSDNILENSSEINTHKKNIDCNRMICSYDIVWYKNYYYISSIETNAIFKMDDSFTIVDVYFFPNIGKNKELFRFFVSYEEFIYFFPFCTDNAYSFNMDTEQFDIIDLGLTNVEKKLTPKFSYVVRSGKKIYAIGRKIRGIFCYDVDTKKCERYIEGLEDTQELYTSFSVAFDCNKMIFLSCIEPKIYIFDIETKKTREVTHYDVAGSFRTIEKYDDKWKLSDENGDFYILDRNFSHIEEHSSYCEKGIGPYRDSVTLSGGNVLLANNKPVISINGLTGLDEFVLEDFNENKNPKFSFARMIGDKYYFQLQKDGSIYELDNKMNLRKVPVSMTEDVIDKCYAWLYEKSKLNTIFEEKWIRIEKVLDKKNQLNEKYIL